MRGFIAFAQWIQNLCKKPSEIEELENTTKTLGSIVGNADKLPRFIRHTRAKTTDGSETISTDQIREVIKNGQRSKVDEILNKIKTLLPPENSEQVKVTAVEPIFGFARDNK